jgi:hypothetical protein
MVLNGIYCVDCKAKWIVAATNELGKRKRMEDAEILETQEMGESFKFQWAHTPKGPPKTKIQREERTKEVEEAKTYLTWLEDIMVSEKGNFRSVYRTYNVNPKVMPLTDPKSLKKTE